MMRPMIRTNAPITPPAMAGTGMEDLLLKLTWPGGPVPEGMGEGVGITGGEVVMGDSNGIVEGESDEDAEDEMDGASCCSERRVRRYIPSRIPTDAQAGTHIARARTSPLDLILS